MGKASEYASEMDTKYGAWWRTDPTFSAYYKHLLAEERREVDETQKIIEESAQSEKAEREQQLEEIHYLLDLSLRRQTALAEREMKLIELMSRQDKVLTDVEASFASAKAFTKALKDVKKAVGVEKGSYPSLYAKLEKLLEGRMNITKKYEKTISELRNQAKLYVDMQKQANEEKILFNTKVREFDEKIDLFNSKVLTYNEKLDQLNQKYVEFAQKQKDFHKQVRNFARRTGMRVEKL